MRARACCFQASSTAATSSHAAVDFKPFLEQHTCCMVHTAKAISVEGGGKFSIESKSH